jgi:hypothetical protein
MSGMTFLVKKSRAILLATAFVAIALASSFAQVSKGSTSSPRTPPPASHEAKAGREYSGMYSFLEDGEFLQITVEDEGKVTGFVSRYGEGGSDKGTFLEHYLRSGSLDGAKLIFTTKVVEGAWFDFKGTVERGEGKNPGDEGYYVLKGALTDNSTDAAKKVTSHSRDVVFKKFPEETKN